MEFYKKNKQAIILMVCTKLMEMEWGFLILTLL